ncbi:MAG: VWA domain-containing protein [Bacteroidota bacterium]
MRTGRCLFLLFALYLTWSTAVPTEMQAQQRTLGPVLRIYTDPFLFDTVRCRIRKCIPITFHNIGDTALTVHNHDVVRRPFSVRIDTPLVLQPGEMRTFELCYNASQYTKDSQRVFIRADTRLPLSIAMVHDVSSSMFTDMPGGKKRYQAAHDASVEFIGNLLDTLGVEDEAAVFTYDDNEHFTIVQSWTKDTAALRAAIPNAALGTATCTYDAISRVIDSMKTRVKKRILIMVTDGEDSGISTCGVASPQSVITKAQNNEIRIYAITIGNIDRAPLIDIAKQTGGKEFNATVSTDLLSIYRQIAVDMSKNVEVSVFMKGAATGPNLEITPSAWVFDSVQVGETACEPVLVRNNGDAWLLADSVRKIFQPPYALLDLAVDSIAPYQTVPARVCFTPLLPLHYQTPMPYFPSPCQFAADTLIGSGSAFLLPRVPRKNPLLEMRWPEFDTTFCQTNECRSLELENVGDTVVNVQTLDFIPPPFSGSVAVPFAIAPGETKSITICYRPPDAPRLDTLQLGFTADLRAPQRIALLFDEGGAMKPELMPGLSRLLAASAGANDFADGLEFSAGSTDAVAVASFDSAGVLRWDGRYITDKDSLRTALPDSATGQVSCIFDAVDHMLTGFDSNQPEPKSIVLFTAGEDAGSAICGPATAAELTTHALALGARIHCVQLGDADSTALMQLAQSTGGRFLHPQSLLDLILGLRDLESEFSRRATIRHQSIARGVTPIIHVNRDTINCGVYYEYDSSADPMGQVTISNLGDAPMKLWSDGQFGPDFSIIDTTYIPDIDTLPRVGFLPFAAPDTLTIPPWQSVRFRVRYDGRREAGIFRDTLALLHDGCEQGEIDVIAQVRYIPSSHQDWSYFERISLLDSLLFGSLPCSEQNELAWELRNRGLANTLTVLHPFPPMFDVDQAELQFLAYETKLSPYFKFRPLHSGDFSGWLLYESQDTPPFSTIFVLANDASTLDTTVEGVPWRTLVKMNMREYSPPESSLWWEQDSETALFSFDALGTKSVLDFTSEHVPVWNTFPDTSIAAPGDLVQSLNDAMDYSSTSAKQKKYIFAIVNDANAIPPADAEALRDRAAREDVILAIAAVGADGYAALAPTAGTAARFDSCFTLASLENFIYETTSTAVVTVRDSMYLFGTAVEGKLEVDPLSLDFGRIRVGGDACLPVTIRNSGDAPLTLVGVVNPVEPFPTVFPPSLEIGQEAQVELCFAASKLGAQSADVLFIYDGCERDTITVRLTANGFDSVTVGINAAVRGMPGHVVRIPVQLFGAIPSDYGVRSYEVTLSYNKTKLYPIANDEIVSEGTATVGMHAGVPLLERSFSDSSPLAEATYRVSGSSALASLSSTAVLLAPPFLVLHGNALETPLRVTNIRFADGSPAAGIAVAGSFISDSLCFQQERLIDASARYNASIIGGYPNPFNPVATISYALRESAAVKLSVHDALGRQLRVIDEGQREAGVHRAQFDASELPTGVYFYRLESGDELLSGSLLYLK